MFGISFTEILLIGVVTLIVVGPQKLPSMLRTLGEWMRKLRRLTTEVRAQTGIDEILREEGIDGVGELRALLRGEIAQARQNQRTSPRNDPYASAIEVDAEREYPPEGVDAYGALPEDLLEPSDGPSSGGPEPQALQQAANAEPVPAPNPGAAVEERTPPGQTVGHTRAAVPPRPSKPHSAG